MAWLGSEAGESDICFPCIDLSMSVVATGDDRILSVWQWCRSAYLRYNINISFPKNTDPRKTYQWRFTSAIVRKFDEWGLDDESAYRFVNIAVAEANRRGVLCKGLAILHQSDMLNTCYNILSQQDTDNNSKIKSLTSMKSWFDDIAGDDPFKTLMGRKRNALPNIAIWYQANKLSDLFIALSKVCSKAVARLDDVEGRLLPKTTTLYLLCSEFNSEQHNSDFARRLFGNDWRTL